MRIVGGSAGSAKFGDAPCVVPVDRVVQAHACRGASVWIRRPSGSWSKPIGSLRFGGALTLTCW